MINTLYLSGPISNPGDVVTNLAMFTHAAERLRGFGYTVLNPAENVLPDPAVTDPHEKWQEYMRLGLAQLVRAEGVALLHLWEASRGASLEVYVATQLGLQLMTVHEWCHAKPRPFEL